MSVKKTNELLIQGNVSEKELGEINEFLQNENIKVTKLHTKAFDAGELIQLVFNDFEIIGFARDFVLASLLTYHFSKLSKVIDYLAKSKKNVNTIIIKIACENAAGDSFLLHVIVEPDKMEELVKLVDKKHLTDELKKVKSKSSVYITINKQSQLEVDML